ncbi:MAG TPA: hypothetical protein VK891_06065 [Euzebyales bacterium]|nr:hypothetical protein [Euzebyales bacterium]
MSDQNPPDVDLDEFDPAPGVAAGDPGERDDIADDVTADARQQGEADAPVDYDEGSDSMDARVAEALGEVTESPEAQAAADPSFDAPSALPDDDVAGPVDLDDLATVPSPPGPDDLTTPQVDLDDEGVAIKGVAVDDADVDDEGDDLDDLLAAAGAETVDDRAEDAAEDAAGVADTAGGATDAAAADGQAAADAGSNGAAAGTLPSRADFRRLPGDYYVVHT